MRGKLRMKVTLNDLTHEKVVTIPHGWWLPEAPGPDHGVFEVCSNVLVDDDLDTCDVALGSSALKAMICRVSKAEAPERTVTQRWKDAQAARRASPRNDWRFMARRLLPAIVCFNRDAGRVK